MRTKQPIAALALLAIIAAPVMAASVAPDEPLAFAPVPHPRPPLEPAARAAHGVIRDRPVPLPTVSDRPTVDVPAPIPEATVVAKAKPITRPTGNGGGQSVVRGVASWYCGHGSRCTVGHDGGLYAAAGPGLRIGDWRGRLVRVSANGRSVVVRLIDCNCGPHANLIDLYSDAFRRLVPLNRGVVKVTVSW